MCKIAIDCEAVSCIEGRGCNPLCYKEKCSRKLKGGALFDKLRIDDGAKNFIRMSWKSHDMVFIERHWLARVWVEKNFPGIMTIPPDCLPTLDLAIGCCLNNLDSIKANKKILLSQDEARHEMLLNQNLPADIILATSWQEVSTIVAAYYK